MFRKIESLPKQKMLIFFLVLSFQVVLLLFSYKLLHPDHFYLVRGNHETEEITKMYGFYAEVRHKYDDRMYNAIQDVFAWLPIAHLVNGSVLCMHGGLCSRDGVTLDDIRGIERGRQPERDTIMCDLLWSDPQVSLNAIISLF